MIYRNLQDGRFENIEITYQHSNISLGLNGLFKSVESLEKKARGRLECLYRDIEDYIRLYPDFRTTYSPWKGECESGLLSRMVESSSLAGVGPMAAVAGAFSDEIMDSIKDFAEELFVENGGDMALWNIEPCNVLIYPGWGSLNSQAVLNVPPGNWGIASSSGRFGHSFSLGEAEMVTVVAESSAKADAFATAVANQVKEGVDMAEVVDMYDQLLSVTVVHGGKIVHKGEIEISFI